MRRTAGGTGARPALPVFLLAVFPLCAGAGLLGSTHPAGAATPSTVPGAPTEVSAGSEPLGAVLNWSAPSSDGGEPITQYTVRATDLTDAARGGQSAVTGCCSGTVHDLTSGDRYTFRVRATNSVGTGPASAPSNAVVPAPPPPPPGLYCEHTAGTTGGDVTVSSCHPDKTSAGFAGHGTVPGKLFTPGKETTGVIRWTAENHSYSTTVATTTSPYADGDAWCVEHGSRNQYVVDGRVTANTDPLIAVGQDVSAYICIGSTGAVTQPNYAKFKV